MTKRISIDTDAFLQLYASKLNDIQIAQKMGVTVSRICKFRHKLGLPSVTGKGRKIKSYDLRMELYNKGYSDLQIAKEIGVPESTILSWRKQRGLTVKNIIKTSKYDGILTEFGDRISELYLNGHSDYTIAKILEIPQTAVERWRYRNRLPCAFIGASENVLPLESEESLYCDTDFLEKFIGKKLNRKKMYDI
jgi:predicted transcriptional regulator